jgi:hypothetical protein
MRLSWRPHVALIDGAEKRLMTLLDWRRYRVVVATEEGPRITRIRGRWRAIRRARRLARSERALALAVLDLPERLGPPIVARFDERDAFFDPPR